MNSIKRNFLYNAAYQFLNLCMPLITTPYLSRVLGADGMGVYAYSYSIAYYFVIFIMLGLNNYGCREVAKRRNDPEGLTKAFWSIYFLQFTLGIIVNSLYVFYSLYIARDTVSSIILGLYVLSAGCDINWFFFGLEKFKYTSGVNCVVKLLKTLLIFILVKNSNDVYLYCLIMSAGFLISHMLLWPSVFKQVKFYCPTTKEVVVHLKPNLLLIVTPIAVSMFKYMDKIMLGLMADVVQVGYYESAERIIMVPISLITALGTVMLPRMTNLISHESKKTESILHISILFAMFVSSAMCFGIMGVSKEFVPLFYGSGYEICVCLYVILLPSCIFVAFANVVRTQYLLPHQMDREYVVSGILGACVNLAVNGILIKSLGAIGVAIGTFCAEGIVCIYQSIKVMQKRALSQYIYESIPLVCSGLIMFFILYSWDMSQQSSLLLTIFCKIIIGAALYFSSLGVLSHLFRINYKEILNESRDASMH